MFVSVAVPGRVCASFVLLLTSIFFSSVGFCNLGALFSFLLSLAVLVFVVTVAACRFGDIDNTLGVVFILTPTEPAIDRGVAPEVTCALAIVFAPAVFSLSVSFSVVVLSLSVF